MAVAWAAIEALSRGLAAELSPKGIRVVCLRSAAIPETEQIKEVFAIQAKSYGLTPEELKTRSEEKTLRQQLPTLAEIANAAVFVASDQASAMTGAVANLSGGAI